MSFLATGRVLGLPMALVVWASVSVAMVFLLSRTVFGRYVYAIGNREAAAYLSGVPTRAACVVRSPFAACAPASRACCSPAIPPRRIRAWATPTCCHRSPPW